MPSPKRWFAVSREINADPELWELEERYGPHALRLWLEILARLDENDNRLRIDQVWVKVVARRVGMSPRGVVGSVLWMIFKVHWLIVLRDYGPDYGEIEMKEQFSEIFESFENDSPVKERGFSNVRTVIELLFKNQSSLILRAVKWAKYHKTREPKPAPLAPLPTGPDMT
jgi:hypothetical protein